MSQNAAQSLLRADDRRRRLGRLAYLLTAADRRRRLGGIR